MYILTYLYILAEISAYHLQLKCMGGHFFSGPSLQLFTFFFSKIDFYVSGAIKVVLAQIQIYFKLNSGEQTSYCSVS